MDTDEMEREFQRLVFWSSAKIAPHVRNCRVTLLSSSEPVILYSLSPLLVACFETISCFTNLQKVVCTLRHATVLDIYALQLNALPCLKTLHINRARLASSVNSPSSKLKIEHFRCTDMPFPDSETDHSRSQMAFLDPRTLRRLGLRSSSTEAIKHFLGDKSALGSFRNLHILDLDFTFREDNTFSQLHACISPFPAIRDLTLNVRCAWDDSPLPSTPLAPYLSRFKGHPGLLPLVLLGSAPKSLELTRYAPELLQSLQNSGRTVIESVTSLTVQVQYSDISEGSALSDSLAYFPGLQQIKITFYSNREPAPPEALPPVALTSRSLCERLAKTLSIAKALRTVAFDWRLTADVSTEGAD
ncbi:hypothetical protein B0H13DRAFT_2332784 [Mycena leptocephala]|nr:hypothetical protein B0H13DRAFT_2332784 [Mycena leptocephala]